MRYLMILIAIAFCFGIEAKTDLSEYNPVDVLKEALALADSAARYDVDIDKALKRNLLLIDYAEDIIAECDTAYNDLIWNLALLKLATSELYYWYYDDYEKAMEYVNQSITLKEFFISFAVKQRILEKLNSDNAEIHSNMDKIKQWEFQESIDYFNRACYMLDEDEFEQAIADYNKAIELFKEINGDLSEIYHFRGIAYAYIGKYTEALQDFNSISDEVRGKDYIGNAVVFYCCAAIEFLINQDIKKANEYFDRAYKIDQNYKKSYFNDLDYEIKIPDELVIVLMEIETTLRDRE